jgi:hypothetical protein
MTRILHVLDHSLPLHSGYTFRTRALLKAQQGRGWDVRGITGTRHYAEGPEVETVDDLTFHRVSGRSQGRIAPLAEWRDVKRLSAGIDALVRGWRPDPFMPTRPCLARWLRRRWRGGTSFRSFTRFVLSGKMRLSGMGPGVKAICAIGSRASLRTARLRRRMP